MRKRTMTFALILSIAIVAVAFAANPKPVSKVGEEVYACNCGEACDCNTISKKQGKCICGKDMVKAKVTACPIKGKVMLQGKGWDKPRDFKPEAKYACACGPKCDCDTISQKPGKCPCGTEMKEVK
jgi:hypothetical protein